MTNLEAIVIAELRGYMRGALEAETAELAELHRGLSKLVEEKPPQPINATVLE